MLSPGPLPEHRFSPQDIQTPRARTHGLGPVVLGLLSVLQSADPGLILPGR